MSTPHYYRVAYDIAAPLQGKIIKQRNINYLIAYKGKWTDLHISVVDPTDADSKLLETFEKSLSYGPNN
jgi:hypothetical protein